MQNKKGRAITFHVDDEVAEKVYYLITHTLLVLRVSLSFNGIISGVWQKVTSCDVP